MAKYFNYLLCFIAPPLAVYFAGHEKDNKWVSKVIICVLLNGFAIQYWILVIPVIIYALCYVNKCNKMRDLIEIKAKEIVVDGVLIEEGREEELKMTIGDLPDWMGETKNKDLK